MEKKLRIAILPHLGRPINSSTGAARSRVIYDVIDGLVVRGHQVSLFGTADSKTAARLITIAPSGVFLMPTSENDFYRHVSYLVQSIKKLEELQVEFDIVHNHMYPEFLPLMLGSQLKIPMVTTIHTEINDYLADALKLFPEVHLVALSRHHQQSAPGVKIDHVVHNGIDLTQFSVSEKHQEYLLFVGRIKIERRGESIYDPKGILTAINVAKKSGHKLLFSGSIELRLMFEEFLKPHLSETIQFVGQVSKEAPLSRPEMIKLYQGAKALLFPINWQEPFGLVIVEANACGTPVIGFNRGAVPEIIQNGVNGFVVESEAQMIDATKKIDQIDRKKCREYVENKFSREIMVENYEKVYYQILKI